MRRKLYFAAIAAVACAACNETVVDEMEHPSGLVRLNFSLSDGHTKSAGTEQENKILDLQVYVFDDQGTIEAYCHEKYTGQTVLSSASTSAECTPGSKTIAAVVNAPAMPDVSSIDDLNGRTSYFSDNQTNKFQMTGVVEKNVTAATDVTIPVSRIAAKINVGSVTNKMSVDYYKGLSFSIVNIYILNATGSTGFFADKEPELWYNMMKRTDTGTLCFLLERNNSTPVNVKNPETVNLAQDRTYYVYPNGTETDTSDLEWSPRYTRLVFEARLGNEVYYYPVSIPNIERNTAYEVHLTVTRPGSSSPDIPVDIETASVTVNVVDWIDADDINETI